VELWSMEGRGVREEKLGGWSILLSIFILSLGLLNYYYFFYSPNVINTVIPG
jgi:hypothetical protein